MNIRFNSNGADTLLSAHNDSARFVFEKHMEQVPFVFGIPIDFVPGFGQQAQSKAFPEPEILSGVNLALGCSLAGGLRLGVNGNAEAGFPVGD